MAIFLRGYPQYRHEDIFERSWTEGGITLTWFYFLLVQYEKHDFDRMRFEAALQGVDLDKGKINKSGRNSSDDDGLLFKNPKDYPKDPEERARMHQAMMAKFKKFAGEVKKMKVEQ